VDRLAVARRLNDPGDFLMIPFFNLTGRPLPDSNRGFANVYQGATMMRKFMIFSLTLLLMTCRGTWSAPIVLNEYNAVTSSNQLDGGTGADSFFGKIEGNGGNWFELLVIDDHLDMRQWRLDWTEEETVGGTN
jgi:hypothetical protein